MKPQIGTVKSLMPYAMCALPSVAILTLAAFSKIEGTVFTTALTASLLFCALPLVLNYLSRFHTVKYGSAELHMIEKQVEKLASSLESVQEQGSTFNKHNKAFNDARDKVRQILMDEPEAQIEFRLLVVSMRYSLEYLKKDFVVLARDYPQAKLDWKICMTAPEYLEKLKLDTRECDWAELGRIALGKLENLKKQIAEKRIPAALGIEYRLYDAIPQWHGLLVRVNSPAEDHLYLGRTDWRIRIGSDPVLTVGSNPYRYFNPSTEAGRRHIDSFRHWFSIFERWSNLASNSPAEEKSELSKS